jgi:hypothetical protein
MLHAHIRTPRDAFHFIAEVNPYNLQTLRQHVRQSLREDGPLRLSVALDPADQPAFARYTARWLPQLIEAGMVVEVVCPPFPPHGMRLRSQRQTEVDRCRVPCGTEP